MKTKEKLDKSALTVADTHNRALEEFVKGIKALNREGNSTPESEDIVTVLEWFLSLGKQHYKNLLHCFAVAEKGKVTTSYIED